MTSPVAGCHRGECGTEGQTRSPSNARRRVRRGVATERREAKSTNGSGVRTESDRAETGAS